MAAYTPLSMTAGGYPVYPTEIPNIGYIVQVKDPNLAAQVLSANPAQPLWKSSGSGQGGGVLGVNAIVRFVATGSLRPGVYNLATRTTGYGWLSNTQTSNTKILSVPLIYNGLTITVTGTACTVNAADKNQAVPLPVVNVNNFNGVGSTVGSKSFSIGVACPAGIALYATMADVSSPGNRSNVLTLTPSSTASGVGVQILANGSATPVAYGPDSSASGNTNQWYVGGNASSLGTNYTIPFSARYVQTSATVRPGAVNALSTITFSYQ